MIVVTGATGNVGSALTQILAAAGERVIAVSRGADTAVVPDGVQRHRADLDDPASLGPALNGATALFLVVPALSSAFDPVTMVDAAKTSGVSRIVVLSSQTIGTRPDDSPAALRNTEQVVERSGLEWTHLRAGIFASNSLEWAPTVRADRTVYTAFADVAMPVIDTWDVADVAAAVLRQPGHGGRAYALTGGEPTSFRQRAHIIGDALGEPITVVALTRKQAWDRLPASLPDPLKKSILSFNGTPSPAEQRVSPDVATILGRAPRTYADWVHRNLDAFRA
jgi:uncharacterized protein YbjT (DUF2867 family)